MEMRPLNIFQRVMRIWEESHPYNAAQIMHLSGTPDPARITEAWNKVLESTGLGSAHVERGKFRYVPAPNQHVPVITTLSLEAHITFELNHAFTHSETHGTSRSAPTTTMPFRPFILPQENSYYLGIMYQHWVADSVSLRMLVREWFYRLFDPARASATPLHIPQGGFWRYFGPHRRDANNKPAWDITDGLRSILRSTGQFARARRLEKDDPDHRVDCSLHRLPDGMIDNLLDSARRRRMTINDYLFAALARACDEHGATPRRSYRDLSLGTIADLRATSSENLDNIFGMFLGFTTLFLPSSALRDSNRLLSAIAKQNTHHKKTGNAQASMLRMTVGYHQGRFLSPEKLSAFYRNYMPVAGGISNVNMNRSWAAQYHPTPLLDYIRVAPTGPMVPVVVGVTTIGKKFCFVLTRRVSLMDDTRAAAFASTFISELTALAKTG